jgi:hypothetical protein
VVLIRDREKLVFAQTKRFFGPNRTVFELKTEPNKTEWDPELLVLLALLVFANFGAGSKSLCVTNHTLRQACLLGRFFIANPRVFVFFEIVPNNAFLKNLDP